MLVEGHQRAADRGQLPASGCSSRAVTDSGAPSVAKLSHHCSSGRARSTRHSPRRRLARRRPMARSSSRLTSGSWGRPANSCARASAWSGSSGTHQARAAGSQRRPGSPAGAGAGRRRRGSAGPPRHGPARRRRMLGTRAQHDRHRRGCPGALDRVRRGRASDGGGEEGDDEHACGAGQGAGR